MQVQPNTTNKYWSGFGGEEVEEYKRFKHNKKLPLHSTKAFGSSEKDSIQIRTKYKFSVTKTENVQLAAMRKRSQDKLSQKPKFFGMVNVWKFVFR